MPELGRFLEYLVDRGYLDATQAREVEGAADATRERLGQLMLRRGLLTGRQVLELLESQASDPEAPRLGQLALNAGYIDADTLDELLALQLASRRHVAELLAEARVFDPVTLLEIMASYIRWVDQPELDEGSPVLAA